MKKSTKRFASLFLALAMIVITVFATPATADAATKSKTKPATLKVTDTKLSGISEIQGTTTFNSKYIIAYGKNKAGDNVYAVSTNGKKFGATKKVGLTGDINFDAAGKKLYIIQRDDDSNATAYKCVTNPTKIASAAVVNLKDKINVPSGYELSISSYGYEDTKSGKLNITARTETKVENEYGYYDYKYNSYLLTLNGNNVSVFDLTKALTDTLGYDMSEDSIYLRNYYTGSGYKSFVEGSYRDSKTHEKVNYFCTFDGKKFTKMATVPDTDEYAYYSYLYFNKKFYAFRTSTYDQELNESVYGLKLNSKNYGIYYRYNTSKKAWEELNTGKANKGGFSLPGDYSGENTVYCDYYDSVSGKETLSLSYITTSGAQILYTTNGTSWKTLKKIGVNSAAQKKDYTLQNVQFIKATGGTFATQTYTGPEDSNKRIYVISKLNKNSWKVLKSFSLNGVEVKEGEYTYHRYYFSDYLYRNPETAIYKSGNKSYGVNLRTKKTYQLPFQYESNTVFSGSTSAYLYKNKLYITKDAYKTFREVTLKAGSKKLNNIVDTLYGYVKNTSYEYFVTKNGKMYYTTYTNVSAIK